jgi:hypothetical protein
MFHLRNYLCEFLTFGIISGEVSVLGNHLSGISRDENFRLSQSFLENFLPFEIISAVFHERKIFYLQNDLNEFSVLQIHLGGIFTR